MKRKYPYILVLLICIFWGAMFPANAWAENGDGNQVVGDDETSAEIGKYGMLPIYGRDVADGTYSIGVESGLTGILAASAELIVENGGIQAVLTMSGAEYQYLYMGTGAEAAADAEAGYIDFSENENGEKVCTIPVEALDQELNCAFYKEEEKTWYDGAILFDASTLPEDALLVELPDYDMIEKAVNAWENGGQQDTSENSGETEAVREPVEPMSVNMEDGEYAIEADIEGGSGKASISSPMILTVREGKAYATLVWSSSNYDYMIVGTEKYLNESEEGANSSFQIPIACMDQGMPVIADTTAMGTPHEVSYTLTFYSESIGQKSQMPQEAAKRVVVIAVIIIVGGGILNHFVNKKKN